MENLMITIVVCKTFWKDLDSMINSLVKVCSHLYYWIVNKKVIQNRKWKNKLNKQLINYCNSSKLIRIEDTFNSNKK